MTGNPLGDRYQMGATLGFGGMSEVHRGRDIRLGRDVAIKVLRADLARDPTFQTRFKREAQNAASLNHPAIVSVYDTGEMIRDGAPLPYIVMEFVDGETLRDIVKREGPLPPKRAMEITADICAALDFSHRHGIIHRDVKPANVMLTRAGAVKVMDFGIARAVTDGQATVTATAAVIGTAQYLSPEQARGEAVDARSDVYAAGCVLYELLTGNPPFSGDSPVAVAYQHVREEPRPPSAMHPGIGRELDAIVLKALNKNPMNRYQTAADMRSDLVRALSGQAVHATPVMDDADRTALIGAVPAVSAARSMVDAQGRPIGAAGPSILQPQEHWEDPEARSRRVWGFVGIGVICLLLLAGAIYLTVKITGTPAPTAKVTVPSVVNLTPDEATALIHDKGLTVADALKKAPSSDAMKGKVIDQDPSADVPVDRGSAVTLTIGSGVDEVTVPNVQGMDAQKAQAAIVKAGLVYKEELIFSTTAKGRVDKQDPEEQTTVAPGSTVTVFISQGTETTVVPDKSALVGVPKDQAEAALEAANLKWIEQSTASDQPKDQVISLGGGVKPGDQLQVGTPITLLISDNSLMKMPQLTNLLPNDALSAMMNPDLGWTGNEQYISQHSKPDPNQALWGRVVDQLPKAGDLVPKSSLVQISIGVEPKVAMPDLSGMNRDQILAAMKTAGLTGKLTLVTDDTQTAPAGKGGTVIPDSQDPTSGSQVPVTTEITVQLYPAEAPPSSTESGGGPGGGGPGGGGPGGGNGNGNGNGGGGG